MLTTGVAMLGFGLDLYTYNSAFRQDGIGWMSAGGVVFASGLPTIIVGSVRVHRHNGWERRQRGLSLMPTPWWTRHGGGLAIAGRF